MGLSPREVDRLSVWEFAACAEGYRAAHGAKDETAGPTGDIDDARLAELGIEGF